MIARLRNIGLLIMLLLAGRMAAQVPVLDSVCQGTVRNYRVDGIAGSTYSWILTPPAGPVITLPSDADTIEIAWIYPAGIYELQAIQYALNGCEADAVYGQVIVFEQPAVFAGADAQICIDQDYQLMDATAAGYSTLFWQTTGDGIFDDDSTLHPTYTPGPNDIIAGIVTLKLTGNPLVADGGCNPAVSGMQLTIVSEILPKFNPIGPLCLNSTPPALPDTSLNGITGYWSPPVINTGNLGTFVYVFNPDDPSQCGIQTFMEITIVNTIAPEFDPIGPLCVNTNPPALPGTSNNGITGTWDPSFIDTSVPGTFNYEFSPDNPAQCGEETSMDIVIVTDINPEFDPIGPFCQNTTPPALPDTSLNHISGTWDPPTIETSVPGIFDYTFMPDSGQCGLDTIIEITIIQQVIPEFEQIGPLCQYSGAPPLPAISLDGVTGTWNPAWINTSFPGIFTFTFTPGDSSQCAIPTTMTIIILPEITPQFDPIGPLCQYDTPPALPDTSLQGIAGTWNPPVINTDFTGTYFFTFSPDTIYQCVLDTTLTISVVSDILPEFDTIGPLCLNSLAPVLPDTSLNNITGTWYPELIDTSVPGTFTYTFTPDTGQCSIAATMDITIVMEIIPEFDPIGPFCQYSVPEALPDTSLDGIAGTWTPPAISTDVTGTFPFTFIPDSSYQCSSDTTIFIAIVSEITPEFDTIGPLCQNFTAPDLPDISNNEIQGSWNPPNIDTSVPGIFTYTFTPDTSELCTTIKTMDITIIPQVTPVFDTIPTLCLNDVPPDLPSTSDNGITGTWNPLIIDTSVPGTFDYIFTPDDPGQCGVEVTMQITIVTGIIPDFDQIGPLCQNSPAPLLPVTSIDQITGTWNPPVINTTVPGTVTYTFTPDQGQCAVVTAMDIVVNTLPSVYAGADRSIPLGTSTTIGDATATGNGPLTYSWAPAGLLLDPAVLNPTTVNLISETVFTLTVTDSNGCENSDEVTISVGGEPLQAITIPGDHCLDESVIVPLKVDKFISVASFQLKLSYNFDILDCQGFDHVNPQLVLAGAVWNPTYDPATGVITIQWNYATPVTFNGEEKVCDLMFTPKQTGLGQLDWYTGLTDSYFYDLAGIPIPAVFFAGDLIITDPPEIILAPTMTKCVGDTVTLISAASGMYPPLTYLWTYPDGHTDTADPFFAGITEADAGDYILLVTDSVGCDDQKSIRIVVSQNPVAAFHGSDTLVVPPGYILEAGSGLAFYQWNTGEMTENITVDTTGWYWVDMESNMGCTGTDSVYVVVSEEMLYNCLYIPNAFTPDNDGLNDTFKPVSKCPLSFYRMFIYDRWGEKLFESSDISIGWDGTKNGIPLPGDVYVYKIVYKAEAAPESARQEVESGTVTIVK